MRDQTKDETVLTDRIHHVAIPHPPSTTAENGYDRRNLTYSNTFESPLKRTIIRAIEWTTGKITIMRMLRTFRSQGPHQRETLWRDGLSVMQIDIQTPVGQIANIPKTGPVIVVANHPHGMVDGIIMADLISRVRTDYKILVRSILTGIDDMAASFLISVPFPHEPDAQKKGIEMRAAAMEVLGNGGVIALFPSGVVASSPTMFGPAVEEEWNVFTAKMIKRSGATVVPLYFPGSNSRWYQIANRISATLRQSLLLHEIVSACKKPQKPIIGEPISPERIAEMSNDPRAFMAWLRDRTLALQKG